MSERRAKITLLILFIFTVVFGYFAFQARVDYEFEKFFPSHSKEVSFFENFRTQFETDNDFLMLGIKRDAGVMDSTFLREIKQLISDLKKLEDVNSVLGGTSLRRIKKEPLSGNLIPRKLINLSSKESLEKDSEKIKVDPMLTPVFFSKDGKNINLIIKHKQRLSKKGCDRLVANVKQTLNSYSFDEYHLIGRSVAQSFYVGLMTGELLKFTLISIVLVIIFLFITYRNIWSVLIPLLLVGVSAVWTIGLMTIFNKSMDIMLVVLPTLIFIVGISDVVHLYTKFLFLKREGMEKQKAIYKTMNDIGIATLLTSLTTSIGFASLYFVQVPIIQEFGLVAALGVLVTFIVAFSGFIAFLSISSEKNFSATIQSDYWKRKLGASFVYILRNGKKVVLYSTLIILVLSAGIFKIEQKNKLMEELPPDSPLLAEISYFNETFVGTRPFEMSLNLSKDLSFFDYETLEKINQLDSFLLNEYKVEYLISPSMMLKKINLDLHNGDPEYFKLPTRSELKSINKSFSSKRFKRESKAFINEDNGVARISGRVEDYGSIYFIEKSKLLKQFFKDSGLDEDFEYTITGSAHLIDRSNEVLSKNLFKGLGTAFALIALLVGIIFKSIRTVSIVLLVNIIPLLCIAGIMGYMGIDLKISTSVIFTIAFGIAVDDTIHFMSKYRLAMNQHDKELYALKNTFQSTGRAIILTTIILIGGFSSLLFSGFMGTYYIGLLVSGTLILALLTDLILLPYLLHLIHPKG